MKETDNIKKELATVAPLLAQQKGKKEAFKVPSNYFKNLEEQLVVSSESLPTTPLYQPRAKIVRLSTSMLGKVAAILLLIGGSFVFWQGQLSPISIDTSLSSDEIAAYITDNLHEFDEDFLLEYDMMEDVSTLPYSLNDVEVEVYLEEMIEEMEVSDLEKLF